MKPEDLEGTWEGFYTYSDDYPKEFQSVKEYFTIQLKVKGEIFEGSIVDSFVEKYFDTFFASNPAARFSNLSATGKSFEIQSACGYHLSTVIFVTMPTCSL